MMTSTEKEKLLEQGFSMDQLKEIDKGITEGLDTSLYRNKELLPIQMRQIRIGLKECLQVEVYAKPEYDWFQMEEIRKGLKAGIDISIYASADIPFEQMRELRKGLIEGVNLSGYLKWEAGIIREIRKARSSGVNILKYVYEGYDAQQLQEIRYALEKSIDLDPFITKEFRAASIAEIRKGIDIGLDVSVYAKIDYSWRQMREIRFGLENRVDIEKYCSKLYSWEQMREIRLGLEEGLEVEGYRLLRYTASAMREKRLALLNDLQEEIRKSKIELEDFRIEIDANEMEAHITVLTKDKTITYEGLLDILEKNNIYKGIQFGNVEKIVNGEYDERPMLIARGQIPRKGEDGWYEYFFRTNLEKKPKVLEDGSVDYQNVEWFEVVQKGQKLAVYHAAQAGTDGYSVTGKVIAARKGFEQRILKGKGFVLEPDKITYTAVITGMITLDGNEMSISEHLVLDEVNLATGSISFDGSIHILGDVGNGVSVRAKGDIVIDGTVEGAIIESEGSIVLKKGMNSFGHGMVSAGKNVESGFFESAKVMAKGNIEVSKCLNSQLYADGIISSSRVIAGGVAQAAQGFRLRTVGNNIGLHTVLKLRLNDRTWEENKRVKAAIKDVERELLMLKKSLDEYQEKFTAQERSEMKIFAKIESAVFTKSKQLEQLKIMNKEIDWSINLLKEAKIVVSGQAYEGMIVEMSDGSRWHASNQFNVTIKKKNNEIELLYN